MKKQLILVVSFIFICSISFSQDVIVLRENNIEFKVKVTEVTNEFIKYKKWENLDGPIYNLSISSIARIKYKNGQEDTFNNETSVQNNNGNSEKSSAKEIKINKFSTVEGYPKVNFVNVPYFFSENNISDLEIAESTRRRQHAGAWGKMWVTSIPGISSNVHLQKQNLIPFLIQLENPKANPFSICELHVCDIKAQREFIDTKVGVHGETKQEGIKLEFKKLNETGLYLITPAKKLATGEYLFTILEETNVYAFSVGK
ncbi:MAG TPA: hypothetical protein VK476_07300 [Flavobacterium sp.]|nr:hypothetical protein [Flavobacterium sp.]